MNSTYLGSGISGISISDTELKIVSVDGLVDKSITISLADSQVDFGGRSLASIGAFDQDLDLGTHKLVNVVNPTDAQDGATKLYVDDKTVNSLSNQVANYSTQGFKITNLALATDSTDAASLANKLNDFADPDDDLSLASHKLTNVASGVDSLDAVNLGQMMSNQWMFLYMTQRIAVSFANPYPVVFQAEQTPTLLSTAVTPNIAKNQGVLTLSAGTYVFEIASYVQYSTGVNIPIQMQLLEGSTIINNYLADRAPSTGISKLTSFTTVVQIQSGTKQYSLQFGDTSNLSGIEVGTYMFIRQLQ